MCYRLCIYLGSNFSKECLVFVPGIGIPMIDVLWYVKDKLLYNTSPSDRIYTPKLRLAQKPMSCMLFIKRLLCCSITLFSSHVVNSMWSQDVPKRGVWIQQLLVFSELREEDFYINYTCLAYSARGFAEGYFTLLPTGKNCERHKTSFFKK